jgi:hypothetical protein
MQNLPRFMRLGSKTVSALFLVSLGASLMLLLGNQKASFEISVKIDGVVVKIDTCRNH